MARMRLGEMLIAAGVLDEPRLRAALVEQRRWGGPLGRILVDMQLVSEETLVQALSRQLNFPAVNLDRTTISHDVLDLVAGDLAEQHSLVPFDLQGKFLDVAMSDPTNLGIIDELRIRTQLNVRPYLAGPKMIERALGRHYGRGPAALQLQMQHSRPQDPAVDHDMSRYGTPPAIYDLEGTTSGGIENMSAASRRAHAMALANPSTETERAAEVVVLQERISKLEALLERDEDVLRKLLSLLVEKGVATREEILERIK